MNESLKRLLALYKRYWYAPLSILIGLVLLVYPNAQPKTMPVTANITTDDVYISEIETRIEMMLNDMESINDCKVTITLASGGKKEYVREEGHVLVITDKDGNQSAVVSKENAPEIAGVTVICSGVMNINIKNNIIQSVGTVLGIGTNKICVVLRNGE